MTTSELNVAIGQRLRYFRVVKKMSQTEVANSAGLTFQQIQKYEKGSNRLSLSRLIQFANFMGFQVTEFMAPFEHEDFEPTTTKHDALLGSRSAVALLDAYSAIENPAIKQKIVSLVETVSHDQSSSQ